MNKNIEKIHILRWLGDNLRKVRKSKGYSQMALAEAANVDYSYYGAVERGEKAITVLKLAQITNALQVPLYDLFFEEEPATDTKSEGEKQKILENIMAALQKQNIDDLIFIHDLLLKIVDWKKINAE